MLISTAAASTEPACAEGEKWNGKYCEYMPADMATMQPAAMMGPQSMEMECYEWDTMMCDMNKMRCARADPADWNFENTEASRRFEEEQKGCVDAYCKGDVGMRHGQARERFDQMASAGKREAGYCVQDWECMDGKVENEWGLWYLNCMEGGGMYGSATGLAASFAIAASLAVAI